MSRLGVSGACLLGLLALTGSARAAAVSPVCSAYFEALSSEAGDEEGEYGVALDARDDCEDSELVDQLGSLTRLATIQDAGLIVCPWGYGEDNTECQ